MLVQEPDGEDELGKKASMMQNTMNTLVFLFDEIPLAIDLV